MDKNEFVNSFIIIWYVADDAGYVTIRNDIESRASAVQAGIRQIDTKDVDERWLDWVELDRIRSERMGFEDIDLMMKTMIGMMKTMILSACV